MVNAIETIYNGYRFRSRLEARWAVFFDAAKIRYEYEPEGFVGWNDLSYLPDFYLPDFDVYAEVKGTDEQLRKDADKICGVIDYCSSPISEKGLIILGPIPYKEFSVPYFDILFWNKGVVSTKCLFDKSGYNTDFFHGEMEAKKESEAFGFYCIDNCWDVGDPIPPSVSVNAEYINLTRFNIYKPFEEINICYAKARQARFEHGEAPII